MEQNHNFRYLARIILEANTALFVGSGDSSINTDALVQKDHLGLPMINGTSICGVLRHSLLDKYDEKDSSPECLELLEIFGFQNIDKIRADKISQSFNQKQDLNGLGSRLRISSAYFLSGKRTVVQGLKSLNSGDKELMSKIKNLPVREHVRISDKGVALKGGKYDNQVIYKGSRFLFEIELKGSNNDKKIWDRILEAFNSPLFRLGQGTRNGYGNISIYECRSKTFNLGQADDFDNYLNLTSSLNERNDVLPVIELNDFSKVNGELVEYHLELEPDDFFMFSSGFGDDEVDAIPLEEEVIIYSEDGIVFKKATIIPGSSLKGAISHRTCYHYNKICKQYIDKIENHSEMVGENNHAVNQLFGCADKDKKRRGLVIIDDVSLVDDNIDNDKIFNHLAIDRFTGGGIKGALFSEKVSYLNDGLKIKVVLDNKSAIEADIVNSLEMALKDVCKGLLPLGGMVTKGHGCFTGSLIKNGQEIFKYENKSKHG